MPSLPAEDRATWIRHSFQLALVTAGFHILQFLASAVLWSVNGSASLAVFGMDPQGASFGLVGPRKT